MSVTTTNQPDLKMSKNDSMDEDALLDEVINKEFSVDANDELDEIEPEYASPEKKARRENVKVETNESVKAEVLRNEDTDEGEIVEEGEDEEHKCPRSRSSASNSSGDSSTRGVKKPVEYETDPGVLARRQKDIDYGKNTMGYDRYIQQVPKDKRTKDHPKTPPMHKKCSRRAWDGCIKLWRKQLHIYDPPSNAKDTAEMEKTKDC